MGFLKSLTALFKEWHEDQQKLAGKSIQDSSVVSPTITGNGASKTKSDLAKSQYSEFPRYYTIDGVKYDIDNPSDIKRIPLIENIIIIDGEPYGMDALLHEHCVQSTANMDVHWAAYNKVQEYRNHGIIHKSSREIQRELDYESGQADRRKKEEARKKQCESFTVDDMQQFPDIPIAWSYVVELKHTNGIAWCQLNRNNQKLVLDYISKINCIIVDAQEYVKGIGNAHIDLENIDFDYPVSMLLDSMCNTRVECYPYTASGKLSKYPVIIQFATRLNMYGSRTRGEIKILRDGNIGSATVFADGNTFKIGLYGVSLVLKRVDNPYGNIFKFSEATD